MGLLVVYRANESIICLVASLLQLLESLRTSSRAASIQTQGKSGLHPSVSRALVLFQQQIDVPSEEAVTAAFSGLLRGWLAI